MQYTLHILLSFFIMYMSDKYLQNRVIHCQCLIKLYNLSSVGVIHF